MAGESREQGDAAPLYPFIHIRLVVTLVAAVVLFLVLAEVEYIRNFDAIALGLVVIAIVPWLSPIIKSVKVGDLEIELLQAEVKNTKAKLERAENEIQVVRAVASEARGASDSALRQSQLAQVGADARMQPAANLASQNVSVAFEALQKAYLDLRSGPNKLRAGPVRTKKMTEIFHQLRESARLLSEHDFDYRQALASTDISKHLAGVAFAHAHAEAASVPDLVKAAVRETKPFNQYWALKALREALSLQGPQAFSASDIHSLKEARTRFGDDWDRTYELNQLLKELGMA